MSVQEQMSKFQEDFFSYAKLINSWSEYGKKLLDKINQKADYFNSLSEEQRIQFMNTDPDFLQLQDAVEKLNTYYVSFFNFMNEGMVSSDQSANK